MMMGTDGFTRREAKSLWENPVGKLYILSYGFFDNKSFWSKIIFDNKSFWSKIEGYDVKITEKQAKLTMFLGGTNTKVYKKDKEFMYDLNSIRSYCSTPSKVLERFRKAVEVTKETEYRNRPPAKLETLDSMIASIEQQVKLIEATHPIT